MKWKRRLLASLTASVGCFVITALALTVLDLYRTGHGLASFDQATLLVPGLKQPLSPYDIFLIASFVLPGLAVWFFRKR